MALLRGLRQNFYRIFLRLILGIVIIFVYCEYLIYYVTQIQCGWIPLSKEPHGKMDPVYALVIADLHLSRSESNDEHWFTKEHREWQMERAFQTAMTLHRPDIVFVLGDIFNDSRYHEVEFNELMDTYRSIFYTPKRVPLISIAGNRDIGYHNKATPLYIKRFEARFKTPPMQLLSIRGNNFVIINSIAMEGDGCNFCSRAVTELDNLANILRCTKGSQLCRGRVKLPLYSKPIIMQHFPLYRESDSVCTDSDEALLPESYYKFKERIDCLSKESTELLVDKLEPRAAFGAHTYNSCVVPHSFVPTSNHKIEFTEYTVPSFSWSVRKDPKYYLLTVSPDELKVSKCGVPSELTIKMTAILMSIMLLVYLRYYSYREDYDVYKQLYGKKV